MSKNKEKTMSKKYVETLEKFGLLPDFDFTKKEKKVVKALVKAGDMDILSLGDACDLKPEKTKKIIDRLVKKGAVKVEGDLVRLSALAIRYLHAKKKIRKSTQKFYSFIDTLSEKELDDFLQLVYSFEVRPEPEPVLEPEVEIILEEVKPEPSPEEPKPARKPRAPRKKPAPKPEEKKEEAAPKAKPAPRKPRAPRKKPAPEAPAPEAEPIEEKREEANNE